MTRKMKICGKYRGSIVQGFPILTEIRSDSGILSIDGKLSCRTGAYLSAGTGSLSIGKGCFLNQNVMIVSKNEIVIGDNVIIGPNVVIVDHDHNYKVSDRKNTFTAAPIHIGNNVWIGANVTIMKGTSIWRRISHWRWSGIKGRISSKYCDLRKSGYSNASN